MAGAASALSFDPVLQALPEASLTGGRNLNFDAQWKFMQADILGAQSQQFSDKHWRTVDLPHDWSIEGPFIMEAPAGGNGAYLPTGFGWYRKHFTLPASTRGKRISILFDGVYQRSEVWINGVALGMRPYGFISFSYDLTAHLNPAGKPNVIAVRVDNSLQPNCRWYSGSGIYRHTWLVITEPIRIAQWGTCIRTPRVSTEGAEIAIATRVVNQGDQEAACDLLVEILDSRGHVVQQGTAKQAIAGRRPEQEPDPAGRDLGEQETTFSQTLELVSPALWSNKSPHLYQARCTLSSHGKRLDQTTTPFGIRTVAFDVDRGFLLNGEHVKLNGVCIHGDAGAVGTAVPESMWQRRLTLLQQMGCNAIRLSHNPPAPELLDMLDQMGFLVMAEAFDEWKQPKLQTPVYGYHKYFDEWSDRDLTAMIERDRNHPSIVIWSAGNEVPDQTVLQGPATLRKLLDILHRMDPTRLVTVACDNIAAEPKATLPEFFAELDVVGYNYVDRWRDRREKYYSIDRHDDPERRFIGTESSTVYGARGVYRTDQSNSLFFEPASNSEIEVEQLQKFIQTYDYVSGDFLWTGIDYLGESRWPAKLAVAGTIDTCGFPKDSFYLYQSLWSDAVVLHLFPHWNWQGKEGEIVTVTCFTNCDTVELFLNGKSLGVKGFAFPRPGMIHKYGEYPPRARVLQTTADLHLSWDIPYASGVLKAVGVRAGQVIRTVKVQTTGAPAKLSLSADTTQIRNLPSDVCHVTVRVLDAEDRMVPTANDPITFKLQGAGKIIGLDNGQPDSHESYQGNARRAFNGMALALLQGTEQPGSMVLSASSPGLTPAQVTVSVSRTRDLKS